MSTARATVHRFVTPGPLLAGAMARPEESQPADARCGDGPHQRAGVGDLEDLLGGSGADVQGAPVGVGCKTLEVPRHLGSDVSGDHPAAGTTPGPSSRPSWTTALRSAGSSPRRRRSRPASAEPRGHFPTEQAALTCLYRVVPQPRSSERPGGTGTDRPDRRRDRRRRGRRRLRLPGARASSIDSASRLSTNVSMTATRG